MKSLKEYAEEMRTMATMHRESANSMATMFEETADVFAAWPEEQPCLRCEQLRGLLATLGLSPAPAPAMAAAPARAAAPVTPTPGWPAHAVAEKVRKDWAETIPTKRTREYRLDLARKYSITESQVGVILQGPVENGALTRK